ncbi:MAG: ECF transporter S component [Erysipelotrichaceae bacterium]|nr:ECF transporter S component [Erysipelotrichaceae bacterium]MBQ1775853.1 ECF transporter S component [Erysipelotrichaceae bacterium]MBQ1910777.1 ECF transporter S component [Erysipelotrichaceae bacterium]MBQ4019569.1 ECF transporter S component [Erysipelotrichaceae bacterium]MBR4484895.1 ECF transporter S component [Erysipelotrichaceae bacterium]
MTNAKTRKLVFTAMFAVINYVAFTYGKITIPVTAGTSTAIHIANAVVVLSAWFLGPIYGGLSGAVGLSIADVFDPRYITSAPKTFLLKFLIGFIAGTLANRFRLREKEERKEIISITAISAAAALGFNVIADPIVGYFYRKYLLGIPQEAAKIIATWVAGSTAINAVVCTIISVILYLALYKSFLPRLPKE